MKNSIIDDKKIFNESLFKTQINFHLVLSQICISISVTTVLGGLVFIWDL